MKLIVVDTQKLITNDKLYNFEVFKENVIAMIKTARENNIEVIYIRHDDGAGFLLTKGEDGFEIYDEFAPLNNEKIYDKVVNSAFRNTGLIEYLNSVNEKTVIIIGLQTDYCIDATVKAGFEHGLEVIVPENCNSTFDNDYMSAENTYKYYNEFIWKNRYAKCLPFREVIEMMK